MSWFGPERVEHRLPLLLGQPAEIELVVVAQEQAPLRRRRARLRSPPGPSTSGRASAGGQRIEQVLVDLEIEHHVHAVAVVAEIFHVGLRQHVGLGEDDAVALPPLQEFAEVAQHVVLLVRLLHLGALGAR